MVDRPRVLIQADRFLDGPIYAVLAGSGTAVLIGVLTWRRVLARIVLGVWAVLLCAAVLGVVFGGR